MNTLRSVGYDKVGPEYVINEAQAKTAKNNRELDRIIVEGKHQPIVTKEEFERVQRMLEEKNAQTAQWRKNKGVYSDDLWRRKLRCQCGYAIRSKDNNKPQK